MSKDKTEDKKAEELVKALLSSYNEDNTSGLNELFLNKLEEKGISETQALAIIGIESRALKGILNGSASLLDPTAIVKLAQFLGIHRTEAAKLFIDAVSSNNNLRVEDIDKRNFISSQFDLINLKKEGIIDTLVDYDRIEEKLLNYFGYDSIFDYRKDVLTPAYSSAKLHKENKMASAWIERVYQLFKRINNPHEYDRKALIDYFPKIRWHSLDVERGLLEVIRALYKVGVTVVYRPKFTTVHLRGATFAVNGKPCIVLTDYKGYYPTLFFALIHELHHVLFDWELIEVNTFHISQKDEEVDMFTQEHMEDAANKFAREYLFPSTKMDYVTPHIKERYFISSYAKENHVDPSIIYAFYAFENPDKYKWINQFMPDIKPCIRSITPDGDENNIKQIAISTREKYSTK
jgi:Zn-dependent peptidase ImmA (M78 family)